MGRLLLVAALLFVTATAFAQSQITMGAMEGTVSDPNGGAIIGATVVIKHVATGVERTLTTDEAGRFVAPVLPVGDYQITVSATGFTTLISRGYTLDLGQTVVVRITLQIGTVTQTVTVEATTPLIETARTDQSTLVNARNAQALPLNGRRFLDLAFLTPLVTKELERNTLSIGG